MKQKFRFIGIVFVVFFMLTVPTQIFAQDATFGNQEPDATFGNQQDDSASQQNPTQSPQSVQDISLQFHLENPLGNNGPSNLEGFIAKILDVIILIAIPIVTFFIIYSGLLFVMAAGNSEKLSKAKTTLMYTLIGAALLLGAKVLALAIESTLKDITTTSIITNLFG